MCRGLAGNGDGTVAGTRAPGQRPMTRSNTSQCRLPAPADRLLSVLLKPILEKATRKCWGRRGGVWISPESVSSINAWFHGCVKIHHGHNKLCPDV